MRLLRVGRPTLPESILLFVFCFGGTLALLDAYLPILYTSKGIFIVPVYLAVHNLFWGLLLWRSLAARLIPRTWLRWVCVALLGVLWVGCGLGVERMTGG